MDNINRVQDKIDQWNSTHPRRAIFSAPEQEEKLEFLERIKKAFGESKDPSEQKTLRWVESEIKRTAILLQPSFFERMIGRLVNLLQRADHWISIQFLGNQKQPTLPSHRTPKWAPAKMSRSDREDKEALTWTLEDSLRRQGLPWRLDNSTTTRIYTSDSSFIVKSPAPGLGENVTVSANVERSPATGRYHATSYDITALRDLTPQVKEVNGVNVTDLVERMAKISWKNDYSRADKSILTSNSENEYLLKPLNAIFTDMNRLLMGNDSAARKVHDQLAVRFFADTPNAVLVPDMDKIKKAFEHKIHVDLGSNAGFQLHPAQAMMLLNRGVVNLGSENDGQRQPWLTIQGSQRDENGFYQVRPIEGSERFSIRTALAQAGVVSFGKVGKDEENIQRLLNGQSLRAILEQNGQQIERFIQVDPAQQRIAIDWIRTENNGLFQKDAQLATNLDRYVGQQQGTYQDPVLVPSEKVVQSALWAVKTEINGNNLATLEKQLADIGVLPLVAKEVLDLAAGSNEPYIQHPYRQEYSDDKVLSQLRFRKDPDTDWVHFAGFDMKALVGQEQKEVNQRYYYNPDDPSNNYTLMEAYRMATGNAVSKMTTTGDGNLEVWRSLGFDLEKTPKGNHQILSTPFDLEKALAEHPHRIELERNLAPGQSLETIVARSRQGEDVHFSLSKNGQIEILNLKVDPQNKTISILRSPGTGDSSQQKQAVQNASNEQSESREVAVVKQSL